MNPELEDRLDRAERIDPEYYVLEDDPLIIEFESDSGNTYTVLPETGYCSCDDHRYRGMVCKHLLALATQIDDEERPYLDRATALGLTYERDRLESEREELEEELARASHLEDVWAQAEERAHLLTTSSGSDTDWVDEFEPRVTEEDAIAWESGSEPKDETDDIARIAETAETE